MNSGNIEIKVGGGRYDTGKKWVDPATNVAHVIYRKTIALDGTTSSLPNNTTKNVPHGEAVAIGRYGRIVELRADNGTEMRTLESTGITAHITATNVVIATASDLSAYIRGMVTIEFCL